MEFLAQITFQTKVNGELSMVNTSYVRRKKTGNSGHFHNVTIKRKSILATKRMFLKLNHQHLSAFVVARELVVLIYQASKCFPSEERYSLTSQIRRAGISVYLNISEGCSRASVKERLRFFEIARGSLIEVDAAFEVAEQLGYIKKSELDIPGNKILSCFKLLSGLIKSNS